VVYAIDVLRPPSLPSHSRIADYDDSDLSYVDKRGPTI